MIVKTMLRQYNKYRVNDLYMLGYIYNNNVYVTIVKYISQKALYIEVAPRKQGYCLRFKPTKETKEKLLKNKSTICLGNSDILVNDKYNKGELLEKKIFELNNQVWKKDNTPFYIDGDIIVNDIKYQIKFEQATLTTTKQLKRLHKIYG